MNPPVVYQTSAGGVVLLARHRLQEGAQPQGDKGYAVCLIHRQRYQRLEWCLPKGHLELKESPEQAALREVHEETGLQAEVVETLGQVNYQFHQIQRGVVCEKTVHFFLMRACTETLAPLDKTEVVEAAWVDLEEAVEQVTYPNERRILEQAKELLQRPDIVTRLNTPASAS